MICDVGNKQRLAIECTMSFISKQQIYYVCSDKLIMRLCVHEFLLSFLSFSVGEKQTRLQAIHVTDVVGLRVLLPSPKLKEYNNKQRKTMYCFIRKVDQMEEKL